MRRSSSVRQRARGEEPILRVGAGEYSEGEVLSALDLAWSELAPRDRCVLDAFYADGGSTDVAARACAIRRENVKVCLHRAPSPARATHPSAPRRRPIP
jgi:DNA-directed RNA polymerase specialized sigma24 family protein